jgi:hypothetical protein
MFHAMVDGKKEVVVRLQREIAEGEAHVAMMEDAAKHDQDSGGKVTGRTELRSLPAGRFSLLLATAS